MHIIGTAGHVDHGKSSLVTALTGTNPDRWREEQMRGMTLDLGFAHLILDDGAEAGIVDVPGHERFIHNMLAGAAGMELLLLIVAANEGAMPQTIEHLQILQYLNVARTLVVLTKCDLVSEIELAQMRAKLAEDLRGTIAQDAPMLAVSSTSGSGLRDLRTQIGIALRSLAERAPDAPMYLPVDRVFTIAGRGTVLTGTLMQGSIASGDSVMLEPLGRRARIRSLQVFGEDRERATGGTRVALNVGGVSHHDIARGSVITSAELRPGSRFDVNFLALEDAVPLLRRRQPVRAYIGAAEVLGTLRFESLPTSSASVRAQLHLRTPTVAFPGVRFVVRRLSPKTLLGGGVLEGALGTVTGAGSLGAMENIVLGMLRERAFASIDAAQAAYLVNLREEIAARTLERLADLGEVLRIERPHAYVDAKAANEVLARALDCLEVAQQREPWAMGTTSLALARELALDESLLARVLTVFARDGKVAYRDGYYATLAHQPTLTAKQKAFFDEVILENLEQPYVPCPFSEVLTAVKQSDIEGISRAFDMLLARGAIVKVGEALYRAAKIAEIQDKIAEFTNLHERMTMAEFRDLLGTSRKHAVPLLEWFDARSITMRDGDYRRMRRP